MDQKPAKDRSKDPTSKFEKVVRDFVPEDTWLLLMECRILRLAEVVKAGMEGALTVKNTLRQQLENEIRNCLRRINDVSQAQLDLL